MSFRIYLLVGLAVGGLIFLISTFFGDAIVTWGREQQFQAAIRNQVVIDQIIFEPFIFVMGTRPWGPIVAGLAWPAVILWLLLIFLSILIIAGVDVARNIDTEINR